MSAYAQASGRGGAPQTMCREMPATPMRPQPLRRGWKRRLAACAAALALLCAGVVLVPAAQAAGGALLQAPQADALPQEAVMVVEIPAGSINKYEIDEDGYLFLDRVMSMPVAYPANYGSLPRTLAGDGDPLDALVLSREPLHPGVLVRFRPIGVLRMRDAGEADEKVIGVPADDVDPHYAAIRDIHDVPAMERARIEAFFRVYKDLPGDAGPIELDGYGDAAEARALISEAVRAAAAP